MERRIVAFVRPSRELGFSLDEVRALLRLGGPEKASCREVREIAAHHLDDIRAKINDLRKLERLLTKTIAQAPAHGSGVPGVGYPRCPALKIVVEPREVGFSAPSRPNLRRRRFPLFRTKPTPVHLAVRDRTCDTNHPRSRARKRKVRERFQRDSACPVLP
ncbi:MerR family DNA-binding protein, partial [Bradyrhizobium sp. STM 3843]|uniref:MerR family DNA-binding protein n=1 Tax=Bradyrhizobium sp. STM 3843 TaxID=551947 RepID=UPI001FCB62CF